MSYQSDIYFVSGDRRPSSVQGHETSCTNRGASLAVRFYHGLDYCSLCKPAVVCAYATCEQPDLLRRRSVFPLCSPAALPKHMLCLPWDSWDACRTLTHTSLAFPTRFILVTSFVSLLVGWSLKPPHGISPAPELKVQPTKRATGKKWIWRLRPHDSFQDTLVHWLIFATSEPIC